MVDSTGPIDPSHKPMEPMGPSKAHGPHHQPTVKDFEGHGPTYKTWSGMKFTKDQWKSFMNDLAQNAISQVKNQSARMQKALRKLREEETR